MDDKLRDLISQASSRVDAATSAWKAEHMRKQEEEFARDFEVFKSKVESVLGKDVLEALAPVTFNKNFVQNSMTFRQDSRTFRLQQVTGMLVQLDEEGRPTFWGNQFNLNNPDARDSFLHHVGAALKK